MDLSFPTFLQPSAGIVSSLLPALIIVLVFGVGIYALRAVAVRSIADGSTRYRVRKAITYTGYFIAGLFLLSMFSSRVAQLSVVIGAIGAGVAFALQEVIASIAGWVALSFANFYKPGDRVQVGGIKGDVIDIGILRTTLMEVGGWVNGDQYNGRIVRVANSFVFKEPVYNYSGEFSFLWDEFKLPVRYGSDWKLAQQLIETAVKGQVEQYTSLSHDEWNMIVRKFLLEQANLEPSVTLVATDNWIEFTVRYIVDYRARRSTRDAIMRAILDAFDATDGKVQMGSATMELVGPAPQSPPGEH
ncbi:MAG: mechanosensitive ion channel [Sphingomonadales bacterium]|nr:mechanosensitive ion channel [Sphingomonadales bacterium]MBU3991610.1 mechanosensitive ion channel family protein [Alphaproteobacteria bacterium]